MITKEDILKIGSDAYTAYEDTRKIPYSNQKFAENPADSTPAYILAEERFVSGHDDSAGFVEIIDTNENIMRRWRFTYPTQKCFDDPRLYIDDCLIFYLKETFGLPVKRGDGYTETPAKIKAEELF